MYLYEGPYGLHWMVCAVFQRVVGGCWFVWFLDRLLTEAANQHRAQGDANFFLLIRFMMYLCLQVPTVQDVIPSN